MLMHHDGVDLVYEIKGSGDPLLLIHGTGAQIEFWGRTIDDLVAAGHRVIAYDRRGYGRSTNPPVRDYRRHVADAVALLEHLAVGPITVVGWSSGANVALAVAVTRPDLVRNLVVVEPPLHGVRNATVGLWSMCVRAKIAQLRGDTVEAASIFFRWVGGETAWQTLPSAQRDLVLGNAAAVAAELDLNPYGALCEYVALRRIRALPMPITFLVGERTDPFFTKVHRWLTRKVPAIQTEVIPGASHLVHIDAPEAFAAAICKATATIPRETS
jgi:pimeloyl-ACP methyl ester carboxylesterase